MVRTKNVKRVSEDGRERRGWIALKKKKNDMKGKVFLFCFVLFCFVLMNNTALRKGRQK